MEITVIAAILIKNFKEGFFIILVVLISCKITTSYGIFPWTNMQYLWNIVQLSAHLRIYCHRFSLNSISTIRNSWLALSPFLALNRSSSLATGAATSTICPKASPSLLAPFRRTVISSVNTGFTFRWTYPRLFAVSPLQISSSPA